MESWCRNCGHSEHVDPVNGDFCWAIVRGPDGGICGCESWSETWPCEDCNQEPCECRMGDDMDLTSDPLPSVVEEGSVRP